MKQIIIIFVFAIGVAAVVASWVIWTYPGAASRTVSRSAPLEIGRVTSTGEILVGGVTRESAVCCIPSDGSLILSDAASIEKCRAGLREFVLKGDPETVKRVNHALGILEAGL